MSAWNTKPGPAGGGSPEFVHVDAPGGAPTDKSGSSSGSKPKASSSNQRGRGGNGNSSSSSSGYASTIARLIDQTKPEDPNAIRKLAEQVRGAGANGARDAVEALRQKMLDKNATAETRMRAISVARVLAQRAASGPDAQRQIAAPMFVNALKNIASDPNVRGSLKTWASQIRIGDPNDATTLTPITGLDDHLTQTSDTGSQDSARRPSANPTNSVSFQSRPQPGGTEEDPEDDLRQGVRSHNTGTRVSGEPMAGAFGVNMPGGFGIESNSPFEANGTGPGGPPSVREFPQSSIQPMAPPMLGSRPSFASAHAGWGDEDDGVQSDAPSTRSRRPGAQPMPNSFGATPSMDGGREARGRLEERSIHNGHGHGQSTRASSLVDGTLSEPEEPSPRGRHARPGPGPTPGLGSMPMQQDPRMYPQQRMPMSMPPQSQVPMPQQVPMSMPPAQQAPRQRHASPSPEPDRGRFRSRSPSPSTTTRSHMTNRSRAQSRRRGGGPRADPAAMLVNLAGIQFVRATQQHYATREGELTLREGDVLAVIRSEDGGRYWLGHMQGQVGRFPAHVVELLSHQTRGQGDSVAQEEKTAELLRRSREIEDFMDQLHDFDITRYCITEDSDIQADLAGLMGLRNELVRHLDETTTGMGRLKAMLNKIKEAQRVHDKMIDSRIAGYTARSSLHDATPRNHFQELPANPIQYAPYDMSQYVRRTSAPQQIEQPPPPARQARLPGPAYNDPTAALRYRQAQDLGYGRPVPPAQPRARTYSYAPAPPAQNRIDDEHSSAYISEPSTPGESVGAPPVQSMQQPAMGMGPMSSGMGSMPAGMGAGPSAMGGMQPGMGPVNGASAQYGFPGKHDSARASERWGDAPSHGKEVDPEGDRDRRDRRGRGGSHVPSETSAHTHTSRRNGF